MGFLTGAGVGFLVGGPVGAVVGASLSSSGDSGKFKPQTTPKLTPAGEKLEKGLFTSIKSELFPENLASRFVGDAKKLAGARRRHFQKTSAGAGFTGPESVVSGDVGKGFLRETATRLGEAGAGARVAGGAKREFAIKRLGKLQNFINLQSGTPILRAQAGLIKGEQGQAAGAQKGAALGSLAGFGAIAATGGFR